MVGAVCLLGGRCSARKGSECSGRVGTRTRACPLTDLPCPLLAAGVCPMQVLAAKLNSPGDLLSTEDGAEGCKAACKAMNRLLWVARAPRGYHGELRPLLQDLWTMVSGY